MDCKFLTLAAGAEVQLALSCIEGVVYDGSDYTVGCARVHRSRVGDPFLKDGGETRFTGARDIRGLERSDVFLLEGEDRRECKRHETLIAASERFTRLEAGLLRVPVDAAHQERLARKRAPWIVPGRYEIPQALKLDTELDGGGITVTNRNRYKWLNCNQIQINGDDNKIWETGDYLKELEAGETYTWPLDAFEGDHDEGLESLSEAAIEEIRGKPFVIMCRAPRGRAFGRTIL